MKQEAYSIGNVVVCWTRPTHPDVEYIKEHLDEFMGDISTYRYATQEFAEVVVEAVNRKIVRLP